MKRILLTVAIVGLLASPGLGQEAGQIVGVVRDASGAVIQGATVKATEVGTGFARTTTTGSDGQFVLPALRPTRYDVAAEAAGFRAFRRSGAELLANQSLTLNITLDVGAVTESVTVAGATVQVDTTTSSLTDVVDRARIVEMPLNGRDVTQLTTLVAGTSVISVSTEQGKSIPGGLRLTSNGTGRGQVAYRLDGTSNTDFYYQENQTFPNPDAVQEFSIQTSNYSAAQGNSGGAMVNVVTRSGTNEFHGGASEFVRNREFNARNFFFPTRDFIKRNQFGAQGGGPVRLPGYDGRNKTFFFLSWQGTRFRNRAGDASATAPTIAQRAGNFGSQLIRDPLLTGACTAADRTACFPNNTIPASRFDPATLNVLRFIPAVGGDGRVVYARNIAQELDQGVSRVDHQVTSKDRLSGRYFIDHFRNAPIFNDDNLLTYRGGTNQSRVRTQNSVLAWTHTFGPSLLNDFHFGYNRVHSRRAPPANVPGSRELGIRLPVYPTLPSIAQIEVAGGFFNIGDNLEAKFVRNGFEWNDRLSWVKGRHSMQFGGEVQRYRVDIVNEFRRAGHFVFRGNSGNPRSTGVSMADFMIGTLDTFDQGTGEYKNNRATYAGVFFHDDFKVHRRLTLNLGIRYENGPPWHEERGRIEIFRIQDFQSGVRTSQFRNAPPGVTYRGDPGAPEDGTRPDNNNFAGRTGFAWDVFGDGKTSIRGGAGMFYDQHVLGEFNNGAVNAPPWSIRLSVNQPQGPFSDPYRGRTDFNSVTIAAIGQPDAPFPRPVLLTTYDDRNDTPLNYTWNLTLEREVLPEWVARAAYVGSASNYGRFVKQLNAARFIPGSTAGTDARRLFAPDLGSIEYFTQDRRSFYHSLQTGLTKRFTKGFTVLANHTWSKNLGNYGPGDAIASAGTEVAPWFVPGADSLLYGPAEFDHRHRFVVSYVWDLPKAPTTNPFLRTLLHGWQTTGIGQYQSGFAYTVTSGQDNSRTGLGRDRAILTGASVDSGAVKMPQGVRGFNPAAFASNSVLGTFGTVGTGAFTGPHLYTWDLGFFKTTRITERVNIQFRAEFFNIFNLVNFALPNRNISGARFGDITSTLGGGSGLTSGGAGDPRIIQFGLKLSF